jgi:mannitol/fructose-specific phosphotransferase system IIA component (Ntr-type)
MDQSLKTLADYTSPGLMVPELRSNVAAGVIAELCSLLQRQGRLNDSAAFYEAVMRRELLSTTSFGSGWALPHARLKGLRQLSFALARSSQPLVWFGESGFRPQTVFLFAVREEEVKTYLDVIAAVARLNQNTALLEQLLHAPNGKTMFGVLEQIPLRTRGLETKAATPRRHGKLHNILN